MVALGKHPHEPAHSFVSASLGSSEERRRTPRAPVYPVLAGSADVMHWAEGILPTLFYFCTAVKDLPIKKL